MKRLAIACVVAALLVPSVSSAQRMKVVKAGKNKPALKARTASGKTARNKQAPANLGKRVAKRVVAGIRPSVVIQTQMGQVSARVGSLTNEQVGLLARIEHAEGQRSQARQSGRHGQMTFASRNIASASTRLESVNKEITSLKNQLSRLQKELDVSLAVEKLKSGSSSR